MCRSPVAPNTPPKVASGSRITVRIPAVRGDILDRNGIPLVQNRASFDVDFFLPDMVRAYRESHGSVPMHSLSRHRAQHAEGHV